MRRSGVAALGTVVLALAISSGSLAAGTATAQTPEPASRSAVKLPPANVKWDYEIGRAYTPPKHVKLVSRDREAKPAAGLYNFCYVNAYQTQASEVKWWKAKHNNLLLKKNGHYVVDSYWGETLLDISTAAKRQAVARIVNRWITGCKNDGFNAVEPDNLDSWTRSQGQLTKDDAFAYAKLLIDHAHNQGLAIAQKNAAGQAERGKQTGFDFAVAEECGRYHECGRYIAAYGSLVYVVEYRDQDFAFSCSKWGDQLSIIRRDRNVTGPGSASYVYDSC